MEKSVQETCNPIPVRIVALKHGGRVHRSWPEALQLQNNPTIILIPPNTKVVETDGRTWSETFPVVAYFHPQYWFNVYALFRPEGTAYYCNVASPLTQQDDGYAFVDYDLDVLVHADGKVEELDRDEYVVNLKDLGYPLAVQKCVEEGLQMLLEWIHTKRGPFSKDFERYANVK